MFKIQILTCLIIETHSWSWFSGYSDPQYPSPRGTNFWKCRVSKPTYVCDPDGMLTDDQREEIVHMPNSKYQCMREGLRLVVALAKDKIGYAYSGNTYLCNYAINHWKLSNTTKCESDIQGIEVNKDEINHCYILRWLVNIHEDDYYKLANAGNALLNKNNTFDALKNYITYLRNRYIQRFSTFDNDDVFNEKSPQQYSYKL
ncbi:unnamed protein product [Meloidogyne enterolobii]|uniref:Uncharacterized protein n=1 Tax=Meloidogyne enterolobii TaxID=390850 RepID=A0ACB1AT55_MELEN